VNVVDSSGWLEYFADGPNATFFAGALHNTGELIVPVITVYEVFKYVSLQRGEGAALQAVAIMRQGRFIDVTDTLALSAAQVSIEYRLPMADSLILATAREHEAALWTQDADFSGVPGVEYVVKRGASG
jgi:predicted nucleic acid-binding protein